MKNQEQFVLGLINCKMKWDNNKTQNLKFTLLIWWYYLFKSLRFYA